MPVVENQIDISLLQKRERKRSKDQNDPRGMYFRDATSIIHGTPFRRLKHKTQVFFSPTNDHICTRLEHVLHVATIAVSICKGLGLDSDLAWAIGLGHDLGHAPFGHLGEKVLNSLSDITFCHELHSLRVVDKLYAQNLCFAVRDGIVSHCGEKFEQELIPTHQVNAIEEYNDRTHNPATFEGCVVRMADKIAYLGRDYEDAVTLGIVPPNDLPVHVTRIFEHNNNSNIINSFAKDLISYTEANGAIGFSDDIYEALLSFKDYNYRHIYKSEHIVKQGEKFSFLLKTIFQLLDQELKKHGGDEAAYLHSDLTIVQGLGKHITQHRRLYTFDHKKARHELLMDYIASMTDDYIVRTSRELLYPASLKNSG